MKSLVATVTIFVLSLYYSLAVAEKECYICAVVTGAIDVCSDGKFDPSSPLVLKAQCTNQCVTQTVEAGGVSITSRLCDSLNALCDGEDKDGTTASCCNENLCNGATEIVLNFCVIITSTLLTVLAAR